MHTDRTLLLVSLAAILVSYGCQVISASVTSPSDSISGTGHAIAGSSESISTSSGSKGEESKAAFQRDMHEYTASFVTSGGRTSAFAPGATRIAASHGVSNWEGSSDTADAIAAGLSDANQTSAQAEAFCSGAGLSGDLAEKIVAEVK